MSEIDDALAGRGSEIDSALGAAPKAPSGIIRRAIGDTAVSLAKGVVDAGQTLYGVTDAASGGAIDRASNYISELASRAANKVGDAITGQNIDATHGAVSEPVSKKFGQANTAIARNYSPETQAALEKVDKAEGFVPTIAAAVQNPSTIVQSAVESIPTTLTIMGAVRNVAVRAGAKAATTVARAGGSTAEQEAARAAAVTRYSTGAPGVATMAGADFITSGAQQSQQAKTDVMDLDEKVLATSPHYQTLLAQGITPEEARLQLAERAAQIAFGVAGTLSAAASPLGANVEGRAATAGLRKAATEKVLGISLPKSAVGKLAASTAQEFTQEALQSAGEQIGTNVGEKVANPKLDVMDKVGNQAAMGGLSGGLMGAGMHVAGEIGDHHSGRVSLPGDHPEIQATNGPISAAARTAIDTGAAAMQQVKDLSAAADEHQQLAAKGEFGPEEEAKALAAIERQGQQDVKAQRDFTPEQTPASGSDAPEGQVMRLLKTAAVNEDAASADRSMFPFATQQAAETQARAQAKLLGEEHVVIPHPNAPGRFAAVPRSELEQPAPAATATASTIDARAHEAATSPQNDRAEPTPAQAEAGNYKKGHARIGGLDLSIENPAGSIREDKQHTPPAWRSEMHGHYGYIRGTTAADSTAKKKQGVDAFVKPGTPDDFNGTAYVIDQTKADGSFDEHKVMLGYDTLAEAEAAYREHYPHDWNGLGATTAMAMDDFKQWVRDPAKTTLPAAPGMQAGDAAGATDAATATASSETKPAEIGTEQPKTGADAAKSGTITAKGETQADAVNTEENGRKSTGNGILQKVEEPGARADLKGKTVKSTVALEDGSTATIERRADEAVADLDTRIATVEELLRCAA